MTKTDLQLQRDIEHELRADPKVKAARIGVTVNQRAVTLLGSVDSYPEKWAAEDAVKRVGGVRTVAQDLTVTLASEHQRSDTDLAVAVEHALEWDVFVPASVVATVQKGVISLSGQVEWNYMREAAVHAVQQLTGVLNIANLIEVTPKGIATDVKTRVEAALQRHATTDSSSIQVEAVGGQVTLTGHAASREAIEAARIAAWSAPGVTAVLEEIQYR